VLLVYIITLLCYWFIALETQSRADVRYQLAAAEIRRSRLRCPQRAAILARRKKSDRGNIGEGSTFLFLILLGALFVYREVRRQIRLHQQQQNFMMAVTHELKTPIAVTKLNLETLRKHRLDGQTAADHPDGPPGDQPARCLANNILIASQLEGRRLYARTKEVMDFSDLAEHPFGTIATASPTGNG
jgi:two-component system sensor histidine kinase CiaH